MSENITGYIVTRKGKPTLFAEFEPLGWGLAHPTPRQGVTIFPSRTAARQAIAKSIGFARRKGYRWGEDYNIYLCKRAP